MAFRYSTKLFNDFLNVIKTDLANGKIDFYSGTQPNSPNDSPTGTLIGSVTLAGAAWSAGSATGGIEFGTPSAASLDKNSGEEWKFTCVNAGTIGYGRFIANTTAGSGSLSTADTGVSDTTYVYPRIDFSVGVSSGDCLMTKVTYAVGETGVLQSFVIPLSNLT